MERNIQLDWQSLVAEAIKRRKELKMSQEKLAILAGVSKPTLNKFEACNTKVSVENSIKIFEQLGLLKNKLS